MRERKDLLSLCTLLAVIVTSFSCGDPLPADLELSKGYRIFGIRAEPPVARPNERVVITAYDHHPTRRDLAYSWSVCLYSHGAKSSYECISDELSLSFVNEVTPRFELDLGPTGVDLETHLRALGQILNTEGNLRSLEDGIDIFIILNSGDPEEGLVRTVKKLRVIDQPGSEPLAVNPEIRGWRIEEFGVATPLPPCDMQAGGPESLIERDEMGQLLRGGERQEVLAEVSGVARSTDGNLSDEPSCVLHAGARLEVDLDTVGPLTNAAITEGEYTYRWYTSVGQRATVPITTGGSGFGQFELEEGRRLVELIFTVRDPFGGFSIGRQKLNLVKGILLNP